MYNPYYCATLFLEVDYYGYPIYTWVTYCAEAWLI